MNKGFLFFLVFGIIGGLIVMGLAIMIYGDNVKNTESGFQEIYLPSGSDYPAVLELLIARDILKNSRSFDWVANRMNYPQTVEAGKYLIPNFISNRALITQLRNGYKEQSVDLSINTINSKTKLYDRVQSILEVDSNSLKDLFENDSILATKNLTIDNAWATVLADTYKFHWDTDAIEFFERMQQEYHNYWDEDRRKGAESLGLSPMDCIILASIIEKESIKLSEYQRIAGVYVNRLKKDWPLQADPTVKFAMNKPELKRILTDHTQFDSPYNTYLYKGVPPGPIGLPEKTSIEAVLNAEDHQYMYFCAQEDFSGFHVFALTLREHEKNAKKYRRALNQNGIF